MKIGIDFDGVIVERYGIPRKDNFDNCPPTENCEDALRWLKRQGHELYIFTNRLPEEWKKIDNWLKMNQLPKIRISNIKDKDTSVYIDDRAIRFTNWMDICKYFG
jgi:thiamine monophosphate kinase